MYALTKCWLVDLFVTSLYLNFWEFIRYSWWVLNSGACNGKMPPPLLGVSAVGRLHLKKSYCPQSAFPRVKLF